MSDSFHIESEASRRLQVCGRLGRASAARKGRPEGPVAAYRARDDSAARLAPPGALILGIGCGTYCSGVSSADNEDMPVNVRAVFRS